MHRRHAPGMPLPLPTVPSVAVTVLAVALATGGCTPGAGSSSADAHPGASRSAIAPTPGAAPTVGLDARRSSRTTVDPAGPAPAPAALPGMGHADGDAAALAGVHVLDLYDHAIETRDTTALSAMCAPQSTWCAERVAEHEFRSVVPADRAAKVRTSQHENRRVSARPAEGGAWHVQIDSDHTLTTRWTDETSGALVVDVGGGAVRYDMRLAHRPMGWVLLEVVSAPLG